MQPMVEVTEELVEEEYQYEEEFEVGEEGRGVVRRRTHLVMFHCYSVILMRST